MPPIQRTNLAAGAIQHSAQGRVEPMTPKFIVKTPAQGVSFVAIETGIASLQADTDSDASFLAQQTL